MDEPGWSWPAWKFGMKREDLTTKLHDQYNTFPSTIQDPEAFHHDVFEVAITASTTDEFHELMAARKQQRLRELNDSLESAAFEIIAHPKLVGTEQWQYALQLFRTRSLDSLVRYFSSYLPEPVPSPPPSYTEGTRTPLSQASFTDYDSVASATTNPSSIGADDDYDVHEAHALVPTFLSQHSSDKPIFTDEPEDIVTSSSSTSRPSRIDTHIPLSPESIAEDPNTAASSPVDTTHSQQPTILHPTPKRPMTFATNAATNEEDERCTDIVDMRPTNDGVHTPAISEADLSDSRSSVESITFSGSESGRRNSRDFSMDPEEEEDEDEDYPSTQSPIDFFDEMEDLSAYSNMAPMGGILPTSETCELLDSETPTPRPEGPSSFSFNVPKPISSCSHRLSQRLTPCKEARGQIHRAESPLRSSRRTPEEASSRIQKSMPDAFRSRLKGRKRVE